MEVIKKIRIKLILLLSLITFLIPGTSSYFLNGLPVTGKLENILIIFIPLILINCFYIFKKKLFIFILIILCSLKIIALSGPKIGIKHIQFEHQDNAKIIKTYDSFWNNEISSIQKFNWPNKKYFSIDWLMGRVSDTNLKNLNFNNKKEFDKLELFIKSNFYIVSNGSHYRLKNFQKNKLDFFEIKNVKKNIYLSGKNSFLLEKGLFLEKGIYEIIIKHNYSDDWSLQFENSIKLINTNYYLSSFLNSSIFKNIETNESFSKINLFKMLGNTIDIVFLILISLLLLEYLFFLKKKKYLSNFIIFFILLGFLIYISKYILANTGFLRFFDTIALSISYLLFFIYLIWNKILNYNHSKYNYEYFKNFFSLTLIIFFLIKFSGYISVIDFYLEKGDDWFTFQHFSREIVVDRLFPHSDSIYRPGLKYLFALQHIVFGKSSFIGKMLEIWIFLISLLLTYKIIFIYTKNNFMSISGIFIISIIFIGENFINYLGKGLSSYYAYVFVLYLIYFFTSKDISIKSIWKIFPFVLAITWLREEQTILVASLIMFMPEMTKNFYNQKFYKFILLSIKNKYLINYASVIFLSLVTVLIFHKQSFSILDIASHPNVGFTYKEGSSPVESFYRLITGTNNFGDFPRLYSPLFMIVLFISILNIFKKFTISALSSGFFISNLSIYFTYIYLTNVNYNPRYCINLLFINSIYFLICVSYFKDKNYFLFLNKFFSRKQ